jgi:hypothetical protein
MQNIGIFYGHLEYLTAIWHMYFMAIWYILWPFGICFPRFGMLYREKSGNPAVEGNSLSWAIWRYLRSKNLMKLILKNTFLMFVPDASIFL